MKIILVIFLCLTSSQCGVVRDDMENNIEECNRSEVTLAIVKDFYDIGNITLINDILIDITKDKENQDNDIETDTSKLTPGLHRWEIKFQSSSQSAQEINRVLNIVEKAAKKTGQLISKTCKNENVTVICNLNINISGNNEPPSKKQKREIKIQDDHIDEEEIKRILNFVDTAANKNGETDSKNCTIVDGAVICNVYLPDDSSNQSSSGKYKRDTESQNNTEPTDKDEVKVNPVIVVPTVNNTEDYSSNCTTVDCLFDNVSFLVGDECPNGKERAADGTCVEVIM